VRYFRSAAFRRWYQHLQVSKQAQVDEALLKLAQAFEARQIPFGLGLKHLQRGVWEIRMDLSERILFERSGDVVHFLLAGSHDEVKRYLKNR